jgi:phosphoadenosine phosphosulfate reductase
MFTDMDSSNILGILSEAKETYGNDVVFLSSFSNEDMIIFDTICKNHLGIDIYTIDTGRLNQETYEFIDQVSRDYGIRINYLVPDAEALSSMLSNYGPQPFYESVEKRKLCCKIRKVDPLSRLLSNKKAWITGIRSEQTIERKNSSRVEINNGTVKINPIIDWTYDMVLKEVEKRKLPFNKLYNLGYRSIGCEPCTRPLYPGESERDGRWWWEGSSKECGIHTSKFGDSR